MKKLLSIAMAIVIAITATVVAAPETKASATECYDNTVICSTTSCPRCRKTASCNYVECVYIDDTTHWSISRGFYWNVICMTFGRSVTCSNCGYHSYDGTKHRTVIDWVYAPIGDDSWSGGGNGGGGIRG